MNCIREAENYLRYYRELRQSIGHADRMITKLKWQSAPREVGAVNMDVTGVRAEKPINTLNQMYQLQKWQEMRELTQVEIDKIDEQLDFLSSEPGCEQYRVILTRWYVDKHNREDIADELGHSLRNIYRIKEQAMQKFSVMLFGIEALKAI